MQRPIAFKLNIGRAAPRAARWCSTAILCLVLSSFAYGAAWEFRVCADPRSLPYSDRAETGYENKIAEILADEMGAELSFDWIAFSPDMVDLHLRAGTCDAIMGVPDGYRNLLTTLSYYRSPYVFVTRADRPFQLESLDDPILKTLRIGVAANGIPPQDALLNRGIVLNVEGPRGDTPTPDDHIVRQVADGAIDVGITWGPNAGYFSKDVNADLLIEPVTPEFDPPFLSMSLPMTIAVRRGDPSLRDELDRALAARWEDVQEVLRSYGVPLMPTLAPVASLGLPGSDLPDHIGVGVILPMTTGKNANFTSMYDLVGDAAFDGLTLATDDVNAATSEGGYRLSSTSSPSAAAARRAAERMIATEGIGVLIGGLGEGQAEELADIATEHDVVFFDVGSTSLLLRDQHHPTTLHLEASARMYLDALVGWHAENGSRRWFIVSEGNAEGERQERAALAAIATHGVEPQVVGDVAVSVGQPSYNAELAAIRDSGADVVIVMLAPPDQIAFIGQARGAGLAVTFAPLSQPVAQTRDFLAAARERTGAIEATVRVVSWEPTRPGSEALTERFEGRYGKPMEASAWAGYQAQRALDQAFHAVNSLDATAIMEYLTAADTRVAGPKGDDLSFSAEDGQLRQTVDIIRVDPDARWSLTLAGELGIASFLRSVPVR